MSQLDQITSCLEGLSPVISDDEVYLPSVATENEKVLQYCLENTNSKTQTRPGKDGQSSFSAADSTHEAIHNAFLFASQTDSVDFMTRNDQNKIYEKIFDEIKGNSRADALQYVVAGGFIGGRVGGLVGGGLGGAVGALLGGSAGGGLGGFAGGSLGASLMCELGSTGCLGMALGLVGGLSCVIVGASVGLTLGTFAGSMVGIGVGSIVGSGVGSGLGAITGYVTFQHQREEELNSYLQEIE